MELLVKQKSLFLCLVMLVLFAFVSSNASAYVFVNESMTANNASLWASSTGATFNANFATSQYGLKLQTPSGFPGSIVSNPITNTPADRLVYGKQIDLNFSFLYNSSQPDIIDFYGGFGVNGGYPNFFLYSNGGTFYYVENGNYILLTALGSGNLYSVCLRTLGETTKVYINNALVYTNTSSNPQIYGVSNQLVFKIQKNSAGTDINNAFMNNLTLTQEDTGMLMNFTVRDENSYEIINKTLMKFLLYELSNPTNLVQYKETTSGMIQFFNLSAVEYFVIYHDSVYDSRTYKWTQNKNWDNVTLYTLNNSGGVPVSITVIDSLHNQNLVGANVLIQRSINFTTQTVYDGFTDGTGIATTLLNTTNVYTITASYPGFDNETTTITNLQPPYAIQIRLSSSSEGNTSIATNYFSGSYTPKNFVSLYNTTPILFTLNTFSIYFMIEYQGMTATVGATKYDNYSLSPSGGTLTLPILATVSKFNVTYYIKIEGFDNYTMVVPYNVFSPSNASIVGTADDLDAGFSSQDKLIIIIVSITLVVISLLFVLSLVNVDPAWSFYGGVSICLIVFTAVGWIDVWVASFIGFTIFLLLIGGVRNS